MPSTDSGLSKEGQTRTLATIGGQFRLTGVCAGHTGLIVVFMVHCAILKSILALIRTIQTDKKHYFCQCNCDSSRLYIELNWFADTRYNVRNIAMLLRECTVTSKKVPITKTYLYSFDPLKPHFYIVKLGFTGIYIIFLISAQIHILRILVYNRLGEAVLTSTYNLCFKKYENIRGFYLFFFLFFFL